MANNRMWLVNSGVGFRVLLAKYYPSTGWRAVSGLEEKLNEQFALVDFPPGAILAQGRLGPLSCGGMYGNIGYSIELEVKTNG